MSVLIKGLGMPRHCEDCPFLDFSGDYPNCVATGTQKGHTFIPKLRAERMDSCPLVEIPPHGRLIDAGTILVNLMKVMRHFNYDKTRVLILAGVMQMIEAAPTIIEAEEVKG